jgi:hypothetical protein
MKQSHFSHCSLSKCSVSQVVSVYAGYCCFSLRSLYNSGSTEGWLVESITIVALLQWCDIRVGGYTRSTQAPGLNVYRSVTCHLHLHHFATRSERKSCCRIVVSATNSCNYQSASFSTLSRQLSTLLSEWVQCLTIGLWSRWLLFLLSAIIVYEQEYWRLTGRINTYSCIVAVRWRQSWCIHSISMRAGQLPVIYIYITSLHALSARVAVA